MRRIEDPQLKRRDKNLGDVWTHPAYATIGASRVSGQTHLFGSNIMTAQDIAALVSVQEVVR